MIKVTVTSSKPGSPFSSTFETQELAQAWIDKCSNHPAKPWGEDCSVQTENVSSQVQQLVANEQAKQFLSGSDWKVLRHRDQLELGVPTSLSEAEYAQLLADRQAAREAVQE
jgi:hypothetical protein